ncbi:MAG: nucleotide exchange factor GrpE [Bacteroidales bacterium]|nr:nucleotide exchange factor GrpE [Bacteroidales bacterium]MBR3064824.1 nucleotide exchange factor GrpE [Bacteroidales bacterium]
MDKENEEKEEKVEMPEEAQEAPHKEEKEKDRKKRKIAEQAEQIKQLNEQVQQLEEERNKLKETALETRDQYLRLQAEWDNYRRRTAKERLELIDNAGRDILTGFLPILDDCQRALQVLRESDAATAAIEGTELIYNKLMGYLNQRGVERIEARGAAFDTDFHEAVAQFPVEDPEKKNTVIDVTQEGYTLNGTVIRYAKVVVGI